MSILVGVDAGASHTEAVAADRAMRELGRQSGAAGAVRPGSESSSAAVIAEVIHGALAAAKLHGADAVAVGAAGAGREATRSALEAALRGALGFSTSLKVTTDAEVALEAAFPGAAGIILIAGSGSIACGRDATGAVRRAGGWGARFGDEGSGYALASAALNAVARAADGRGPPTALSDRLATASRSRSLEELIEWGHVADHRAVAALAQHVCDAARGGDEVARGLVGRAAADLAAHVAALHQQLGSDAQVQVALSGGLLSPGSPVREALCEILRREMPGVGLMAEPVDPPLGAVCLAARLLEG
ncbi:MAG: hypothetical protein GTN62_05545 [Gemmatimonadales bacterium]|nr:hypothetical protein [Gemmatimonadales bacterium]NIN10968.1 hypothetical protein [Gemmatimonadales bacterium]NIN49560.1 hypothetical protein [Gemmatimonadales bacterium]NIP07024.1 hypothetical protein [Gemmatimonadales bacterium]NIR01658.1 hypothetical protein [Gemmatimonadales bacterium]